MECREGKQSSKGLRGKRGGRHWGRKLCARRGGGKGKARFIKIEALTRHQEKKANISTGKCKGKRNTDLKKKAHIFGSRSSKGLK